MSQGRYSTGIKFVLCKTSHWKFLPVIVPKTILPSLYNFKLRVPLLLSLISIFNELNSLKFSKLNITYSRNLNVSFFIFITF